MGEGIVIFSQTIFMEIWVSRINRWEIAIANFRCQLFKILFGTILFSTLFIHFGSKLTIMEDEYPHYNSFAFIIYQNIPKIIGWIDR